MSKLFKVNVEEILSNKDTFYVEAENESEALTIVDEATNNNSLETLGAHNFCDIKPEDIPEQKEFFVKTPVEVDESELPRNIRTLNRNNMGILFD